MPRRRPQSAEGLSLVTSTYRGEDFLVTFGGYNGRYNNEVYVLKPSHKSDIQSKAIDGSVPDSTVQTRPATNAGRDDEPETEAPEDNKIRDIAMDNIDTQPVEIESEKAGEQFVAALKAEKEELEVALNNEKLQNLHLKQELAGAESQNKELTKKLQRMETLQKEVGTT